MFPNARFCSVILLDGVESIGISLQSDQDFGHKIKQVEPNSPAANAGIQADDCILSLNDRSMVDLPYEEVLNCLRRSREEKKFDLIVIQKSFLLQSKKNVEETHGEIQQGIGPATTHHESLPTPTTTRSSDKSIQFNENNNVFSSSC